jgi:hypothetical protein
MIAHGLQAEQKSDPQCAMPPPARFYGRLEISRLRCPANRTATEFAAESPAIVARCLTEERRRS